MKNFRVSLFVPMAIAAERVAPMASNLRRKSRIAKPLLLRPTGGGSGSLASALPDSAFILRAEIERKNITGLSVNLTVRPKWQYTK